MQKDIGGTEPVVKRARPEPVPPISEDLSSIDEVKELIRENNRHDRPKHRRSQRDFLNYAFDSLGAAARQEVSKADKVMHLLSEMATKHQELPRNTTLSKVLYMWSTPSLVEPGIQLIRRVFDYEASLPHAFSLAYDERVAAVALRLAVQAPVVQAQLIHRILGALPVDAFKRRLFYPLFAHCHAAADVPLCFQFFEMACAKGLEMWDKDYHEILSTLVAARERATITKAEAVAYTNRVLQEMAHHHPVVGAANARLIQALLGGGEAEVGDHGVCSRCAAHLQSFDLSVEDRAVLLDDVVDKLVKPRVEGCSRYEPDVAVSAETEELRWKEFETFKSAVAAMSYDTVIDGANVGYYGLSSWYTEAKETMLRSRGVDPTSIPSAERRQVPFPVDVPPKFSLIEDMRSAAERQGRKPIIVLHNRHLAHTTGENAALAERWRGMGALLPSPAFLNDDYCWLYAVLTRQDSCIISNDQMRDHHFMMLQPRFFVRWRQRHRITYKAMYNKATRSATLCIHLPRSYSVWVQAALGATTTFGHWHVPYLSTIDIIHQATNQTTTTSADVELGKDGDDTCTDWMCTCALSEAKG